MPTKTILITELADPVLHRLAMRLLQNAELRVLCLGGAVNDYERPQLQELTLQNAELQVSDCEHCSIDEVWHAKSPFHSFEEGRKTTKGLLSFVQREQVPVIHYLSTLYAASTDSELALEEPSGSRNMADDNPEEHHRWNEATVEQSGRSFRIYRLPLLADSSVDADNPWRQFVHGMRRFRQEIEDRIPGYFSVNSLRLTLPEEGTLSLARIDDVVAVLQELSTAGGPVGHYFHVNPNQPLHLRDCYQALAESSGVRLQIVRDGEQANIVDKLFGLKIAPYLAYLNSKTIFSTEQARRHSQFARTMEASVAFPIAAVQDVFSGTEHAGSGSNEDDFNWRQYFEKKQLVLPDGTTLNYYTGGQGNRTIVLVNAYGQGIGYWKRFLGTVVSRFRVVLWAPRGDDYDTIGITRANAQIVHVDDLDRVLAHEGIEQCTLIAWCSGPKLALEYCSRYGHRVLSMVLVAASFKGLAQYKHLETAYEKNLEPLLETIEKYPDTSDVVLEYLKGILLAQDKRTRTAEQLASMSEAELQEALTAVNLSLQDLVLQPFCAENIVAYARQMRNFWRHDFLPALENINVPVLFMGGDCDRIASQALAQVIAGMIPQGRYMEIQGGTHYIQYEQWDLLAQMVEDVVNSGGKLKPTQPWVRLIGPSEELIGMRQNHA